MTILELFEKAKKEWHRDNIALFGVGLIDSKAPISKIQKRINGYYQMYWNNPNSLCELASRLNSLEFDKDYNKRIPNSYRLSLNVLNFCIDIYAKYKIKNKIKEYKIGAIPTPSEDLCWIINNAHYVARITAVRDDFNLISLNKDGTIRGEGWKYDIITDEFSCFLTKNKFEPTKLEIINRLSIRSKTLLETLLGCEVNEDNLMDALKKLPTIENNSIFNYKFMRIDYFKDIIFNSKKYAQPTKERLLGINKMIASQKTIYTPTKDKLEGCLVRVESPIFALENYRTVVNIYSNGTSFKPAFLYTDTIGFFDSFKTVTSKNAGRQRLLLDNIIIKDGMFLVEDNKNLNNMYYYINNKPQKLRLSCLSSAPFCNNDKAKRIMMNAKLTAQSVPVENSTNDLTHRVLARVGFADLEGNSYADSIIISQSFCDRLTTYNSDIITLYRYEEIFEYIEWVYKNDYEFEKHFIEYVYPLISDDILDSYENIKIDNIEYVDGTIARVFISWEIPFKLGAKLTNLHGAKGTVGKILPDDEMPKLLNKVGNMEAGPLDIVISGFSTMRRGSLGQIFEAWALASGINFNQGEDFIHYAIEKYAEEMKEFANNSIVEYKSKKAIIPVGINNIMRLYHHPSIHTSHSHQDSSFRKMLKLGEMEKFNLVASDSVAILKELSIRSMHKYIGSHSLVDKLQLDLEIPKLNSMTLKTVNILKALGYNVTLNDKDFIQSNEIISNDLCENDYKRYDSVDEKLIEKEKIKIEHPKNK